MLRFFVILSFWISAFYTLAQNPQRIDSLTEAFYSSTKIEQFDLMNRLAWEYRLVNPDSSILIGKRSYEAGKQLQLEIGLAIPLNFIGVAYEYKGASFEAYNYYSLALTVATNQNDTVQIAYAYNNLGRLFLDQGNVLKALEYHKTALSIFKSLNDQKGMEFVQLNLAQLFLSQQDFIRAEEYFIKVQKNRTLLKRAPSISGFITLGKFYRELGDMGKSNSYLLKADSLCVVRNNEVQLAEVNFLLAENRLNEKKFKEAHDFAQKAFFYSATKGFNIARIYNVLGKIHYEQGNYAMAKEFFLNVLQNSKTFKMFELKMDAHFYLYKIYEKEGSTENKLRNQNQYLSFKDSVNELELVSQLEKLKFQFNLEMDQKKRENELLKTLDARNMATIKKQQTNNLIYAIALGVITLIAFFLFRNAKIRYQLNNILKNKQEKILLQSEELSVSQQKLQDANDLIKNQNIVLESELIDRNDELSKANEELIKINNELEEFSYTVSHNLRGPVASLLGLTALLKTEKFDVRIKEIIDHIISSTQNLDETIRDLKTIIDIRDTIFQVRQKVDINQEIVKIRELFQKELDELGISLLCDFSECPEIYSIRPMIHSILRDLISNSIKYHSTERRPEIEIKSEILGEYFVLTTLDNGLGIDLDRDKENLFKLFKRFNEHTEGKGLGLYLIKTQAEALGGKVEVESVLNQFTRFKVYIKVPQNVQEQILLDNDFTKIFYDATINTIGIIWKKKVSHEEFKKVYVKCLELLRTYKTPNWISGQTDKGAAYWSGDDIAWLIQFIVPEAAKFGLQYIAIVLPFQTNNKFHNKFELFAEKVSYFNIQAKIHNNYEQAREWIASNKSKLQDYSK